MQVKTEESERCAAAGGVGEMLEVQLASNLT